MANRRGKTPGDRPEPSPDRPGSQAPARPAKAAGGLGTGTLLLIGTAVGIVLALIGLFALGQQRPGGEVTLATTDLAADTVTVNPAQVELGRVPLDKLVTASVQVVNRSDRTITLGRPTVETLEGC